MIGCAQQRPFDDLWVAPRPYHDGIEAVRPTLDVVDRADVVERKADQNPSGPITLHDAVTLALRQNHALSAAGWATTAAEADAQQMGRRPNPSAQLNVENFAGPDAGEMFQAQTLRLSQVIELADKRDRRYALGQATQRLRAWDYEQMRLDVASQTALRYLAVVVSQERVKLSEQQLQLSEAGFAIADDRVRNGTAPSLERDQAAVRVALSRIALANARQALNADRADLAATWGGAEAAFTTVAGELDADLALPPLEELKQRAEQSPSIARWDDEIRQRDAVLELERAKSVADPSVGVGIRYFSDAEDVAGVAEISWPLLVFDDNRSAILSARLKIAQARALKEQARVDTQASLTRAYARLEAAAYARQLIAEDALPAAQSAYEAALESYRAGTSDYLTVLDAERSLLDVRNQRLDVTLSFHQSLIELEQLTAHPIDADQDPGQPDGPPQTHP